MSLDSVKMFFQNERNKLIGVGVATCLITTAIVAPSAYFGGQPKYDGVIHPIAFNTVSATGEHMVDYAGIEMDDNDQGWGNEDYISYVTTDDALVRGVMETKDAIGFQALNVAQSQAKTINDDQPYDLNIMSAEFDGKQVDPLDPTTGSYGLTAPINVYMRVPAPVSVFFKDNLMANIDPETGTNQTIWEEGWEASTSSAGIYSEEGKDLDNLGNTTALSSYYEWVKGNEYLADLVMAYTFFNWMISDVAGNVADYPIAPDGANNPDQIKEKDFAANVNQMLKNISGFGPNKQVSEEIYEQANIIWISGTGTVDPYTEAELSEFTNFLASGKITALKDINDDPDFSTDVVINLKNEGSSTAWYMPKDKIEFETKDDSWELKQETVSSNTPPGDAFIGTQSRRSHFGVYNGDISGMSEWGYGYQNTKPTNDQWNYMEQPNKNDIVDLSEDQQKALFGTYTKDDETPWDYANETSQNSIALPLGFTPTTDPLVFYTDNDTTFESGGKTYKPTGMTPDGAKIIFDNPTQAPNITWDLLKEANLIEATLVE